MVPDKIGESSLNFGAKWSFDIVYNIGGFENIDGDSFGVVPDPDPDLLVLRVDEVVEFGQLAFLYVDELLIEGGVDWRRHGNSFVLLLGFLFFVFDFGFPGDDRFFGLAPYEGVLFVLSQHYLQLPQAPEIEIEFFARVFQHEILKLFGVEALFDELLREVVLLLCECLILYRYKIEKCYQIQRIIIGGSFYSSSISSSPKCLTFQMTIHRSQRPTPSPKYHSSNSAHKGKPHSKAQGKSGRSLS